MSTLLAMIFSMSILGGCSPSHTQTGSVTPAGLHLQTPECGITSREVTRGQVSSPVTLAPRIKAPKPSRGKGRALRVGSPVKSWVPERVPAHYNLNNTPYGRR